MRPNVNWDEQADMYSAFSFCELDDTRAYLEAAGVRSGESVLDVCCGPGRVSVVAAEMGARVTGIDSSPKMLERARANAEAHGVARACEFRLQDWNHVLPGQNVGVHDVVVASRCHAITEVRKLSALARRRVVVQIFANAPSIPALQAALFSGCGEGGSGDRESGGDGFAREGGPAAAGRPPAGPREDGPGASEAIYLKIARGVYEDGYDPNVRIFPERFRKAFAGEEDAVEWVCALKPGRASGNEERVTANTAPFLSPTDDGGVEFCIATKAAIIWWDVW